MVLSLGSACRSSTNGHAPLQEDVNAERLPEQYVQRLNRCAVSPVARLQAWLGASARGLTQWSLPRVHLLLAKLALLLLLNALAQPHHRGFGLSREASC